MFRRTMPVVGLAVAIFSASIALIAPITVAHAGASVAKYDATIKSFLELSSQSQSVAAKAFVLREKAGVPRIGLIARLQPGAAAKITSLGGEIGSQHGDIATVSLPLAALTKFVELDELVFVEAAKRLPLRLNASVPYTKANLLRSGTAPNFTTGLTGKGVIVGIIDDGMDFRHRDFRNPNGSTRLLGLWDMASSGAAGSPPSGFTYGGECTPSMLNQAINGDTNACKQSSSGGHGTHVGGIAAGSGQATGNNQPAYRFVGMAPEADLLSANSIASGTGNGSSDVVLDAIAWMKARAAEAKKPIVINMSLGSYYGARDGTSNFERGLSNAGEAGVILVAAAGNEGNAPIRASGTLTQGQTLTFDLNIPENTSQGRVEMWYPGTNAYAISVQGPDCPSSGIANPGDPAVPWETPCGRVTASTSGINANNDDRQMQLSFENGTNKLKAGAWKISVTGTTVATGSTTISLISGEQAGGLEFTSHITPVTTQILTDTSSATRVIGVASHNSNFKWNSVKGPTDQGGTVGDISAFSSRGPRRDCSNLAKCPKTMKPEITAPGSAIMAALSVDIKKAPQDAVLEADGVHTANQGTSMATPHVSGAIALLLQRNPTLTPEQVRAILFANTQSNQYSVDLAQYSAAAPFNPPIQNTTWGYGILDIQKAANALGGNSGGLADSDNVTGLWWNAAESGWGVNLNHQASILFGTLFTYGADNQGLWLVMPNGSKQANGSFKGDLYRTTGPAFDANPFTPLVGSNVSQVGSMTVTFASKSSATLEYTVNGTSVTKQITPQAFGKLQVCSHAAATTGARATRTNYTDLWWVAAESGWGINVTHQDDTLFATLFNYESGAGTTNKGMWLVMSGGVRQTDGSYLGALYRTTGPVFNASPFTPITGANVTEVGSMRFRFTDGENGTLTYSVNGVTVTKSIVPQVFGSTAPNCVRGS